MRARILFAVVLSCVCAISVAGERKQYLIRGGQDSLRTEIKLSPGDCIQIKATGTIKMGMLTGFNGPEGSSAKWIIPKTTSFPAGALIGAIVGDDGSAEYFLVGTDAGLEAQKAGRLTFYINEAILADNSGEFTIEIDRQHFKSLTNRVTTFVRNLD